MLNLVLGTWRWLCQQVLGRRAGRRTLVLFGHLGPHHFGPQEDLDVWIPQQYDDEDLDSVSVLLFVKDPSRIITPYIHSSQVWVPRNFN